MRKALLIFLLPFTVIAPTAAAASNASPAAARPIRLLGSIPLANVAGRIDHLAIDIPGQRLFVAALSNGTVEVVDLRAGKRARTLSGLHEPQGLAFVPEAGRLFVAEGKGGAVQIFDAASFRLISTLHFAGDADNLRYDSTAKRLYVGYGNGALGIVDAEHGVRVGDVELAGHPESFQLEASGTRIFVNIPTENQIGVVDRRRGSVVATWPLTTARANFPMALDERHHRLLIGCRHPAKLIVYDSESGTSVTELNDVGGDADDIFYDAAQHRIYLSAGEGFVDVILQKDPDDYVRTARMPTVPGARTSLFVPEQHRLYLAVRRRAGQSAAIWVYDTQP